MWITWTTAGVSVLTFIAAIAALIRSFYLARTSAALVTRIGALSRSDHEMRSTASLLAELGEVRDAIDKGNRLLKRINSREVMDLRRTEANANDVDEPAASVKDRLRRKAGLRAGLPARHNTSEA